MFPTMMAIKKSHFLTSSKILVLILLLASLLRFYKMDELSTFRADQAIELSGARDILKGDLKLIGIKTSNSEVRNGAVMYYLLAPFVLLFQEDPKAGGILQSLLSLAAIIIVFFLVKKEISSKVALYTSFIMATSSLSIIYSRQTLLATYPLFWNALTLFLCALIISKYRWILVISLGFCLGFATQIHYSTLALVLAAAIFPVFLLERKNWLSFYLLLPLGFLIGFAPMILFELRNEFFNTKMALDLFNHTFF